MNEDEIKAMLARMDEADKALECSVAELRLKFDSLVKTAFASKNEAAYEALFEEGDIE